MVLLVYSSIQSLTANVRESKKQKLSVPYSGSADVTPLVTVGASVGGTASVGTGDGNTVGVGAGDGNATTVGTGDGDGESGASCSQPGTASSSASVARMAVEVDASACHHAATAAARLP